MGVTTQPTRPTQPTEPTQPGPQPDRAVELMAQRASSFTAASRLLPPEVRDDVASLYAVFRDLDDLVDDHVPEAESRIGAVADWAAGLSGRRTPEIEVLDALSRRHDLPREAIGDFCAGMRQDMAGAHFATERELDLYCYRVAGTVGLIMAAMLGSSHWPEARACAISLGIGMQRTNILRDIDEDLAAGRIYISDEARNQHGWSLEPGHREALVRAGIAAADACYDDGLLGVRLLRRGRPAVALAAGLYREILREIERTGLGPAGGRAVPSAPRRVLTVVRIAAAGR